VKSLPSIPIVRRLENIVTIHLHIAHAARIRQVIHTRYHVRGQAELKCRRCQVHVIPTLAGCEAEINRCRRVCLCERFVRDRAAIPFRPLNLNFRSSS
jgi:hypothetical protein